MSSDVVTPGLDDPAIWHMADRNHEPEENWTSPQSVTVVCGQCWWPWPCPTRKALDASGHRKVCECP